MPNLITEGGGEGVWKQAKSDYVICERPLIDKSLQGRSHNYSFQGVIPSKANQGGLTSAEVCSDRPQQGPGAEPWWLPRG